MSGVVTPGDDEKGKIHLSRDWTQKLTVTSNLRTEVVITTRDKIENVLYEKLPLYARRLAWQWPASIAITCFITLSTTNFVNWGIIDAAQIEGAFLLALTVFVFWTIFRLSQLVKSVGMKDIANSLVDTHDESSPTTIPGSLAEGGE